MIGLRVDGLAGLEDAFKAIPEALRRETKTAALLEAGEPMRARMAALAPRGPDAPHIADHIGIMPIRKVEGIALANDEAAVAIGPTKEYFYGWFWEHGWVHHPQAHPFVRPGYEDERDAALATVGRLLWAAVEAATR
ncbi:MAG: hypothetical protein OEW98_00030 [Betaproteobacteria bacterium]|nr:hypothetical protein [Betaproteobacteria bacterium]